MNTDFLFGYGLAFLKICALAIAIMVVVWGMGKASVALHRRHGEGTDGDQRDGD